jgi:hypothetical protein
MAEEQSKDRKKPVGRTGHIAFSSEGVSRHWVEFPDNKAERERMIAEMFVTNPGSHSRRWGTFSNLQQLSENDLDFEVVTSYGKKLLELAEFAPLDHLKATYDKAPDTFARGRFVVDLIRNKSNHQGGPDRILLLYKTDEKFFVPPSQYSAIRQELGATGIRFDAIYFLSPKSDGSAMILEIFPGVDDPDRPQVPLSASFETGFKRFGSRVEEPEKGDI